MNKTTVIFAIVSLVVIVGGVLLITGIEDSKKNPLENYIEESTGEKLMDENGNLLPPKSGLVKDGVAEFTPDDYLNNRGIKHRFLSYEIIDGESIAENGKYKPEHFYNYPVEADVKSEVDMEALKKDYPELMEKYESYDVSDYSDPEYIKIQDEVYKIMTEYTEQYLYDMVYVFFECEFENTSGVEIDLGLNQLNVMISNDDFTLFSHMDVVYFDHAPQVTDPESNKDYFSYKLAPGEKLSCVIGVSASKREMGFDYSVPDADDLYMGYMDLDIYNAFSEKKSVYSPIYGKYVFKVTDLNKMEE